MPPQNSTPEAMTGLYPELALTTDASLPGFESVAMGTRASNAHDPDSEMAALNFVLDVGDCYCERLSVPTVAANHNRRVVQVVLHGLRDDSVADIQCIV